MSSYGICRAFKTLGLLLKTVVCATNQSAHPENITFRNSCTFVTSRLLRYLFLKSYLNLQSLFISVCINVWRHIFSWRMKYALLLPCHLWIYGSTHLKARKLPISSFLAPQPVFNWWYFVTCIDCHEDFIDKLVEFEISTIFVCA